MTDEVPIIDDLHAPDLFVDDVTGIAGFDGVVRLALACTRFTQTPAPGAPHRVVVGRLVLSVPAAQRPAVSLNDYLVRNGANPSAAMAGDPARN